jgi:hypothetical protein
MGYDLRVTRAPGHWTENEGHEITTEEWLNVIATDPELSLEPGREHFARWHGASKYPDAWFGWWRGTIRTKNPDPPMVQKMLQIAVRLNARVQGDDGEVCLPDGEVEQDGIVDHRPDRAWWQECPACRRDFCVYVPLEGAPSGMLTQHLPCPRGEGGEA